MNEQEKIEFSFHSKKVNAELFAKVPVSDPKFQILSSMAACLSILERQINKKGA